ncbi:MAG: Asp/Glu/hydantoin racemase [Chloroflexota bacterium]|nr:MAG: Asp/Glu/hydantoin racemase [Chloroflexota bacterium]
MKHDIAFLHTAAIHKATFGELMSELAPDLKVRHMIDESLLAEAREDGVIRRELESHIGQAMRNAASTGAAVVVCTCSTIGSPAERAGDGHMLITQRIDRAMADAAVQMGPRILIVAALNSTLAPTRALIDDSAARLGLPVCCRELLVANAWSYFERSAHEKYVGTIEDAIRANIEEVDVVVLAQASMAEAGERCRSLPVPVLSSPRLGVEAAIAAYWRARE